MSVATEQLKNLTCVSVSPRQECVFTLRRGSEATLVASCTRFRQNVFDSLTHPGVGAHRLGQQRLAGAGRAEQQHPLTPTQTHTR
jgi:hypothetical protein